VALYLFNKPYGVICQFSRDGDKPTLADFVRVPDIYPAGRLDTDSEGLLLLTDDGALQHRISDPKAKLPKHYWVQVEGVPDQAALEALAAGVDLGDFVTRPGEARAIEEPAGLWPRDPPIRYRAAIPTSWIELVITEGKNRQVRRMTAKVGYPTLRLIRHRIGPHSLEDLAPAKPGPPRAEPPEAAHGKKPPPRQGQRATPSALPASRPAGARRAKPQPRRAPSQPRLPGANPPVPSAPRCVAPKAAPSSHRK
jgi:23S rRNA pseudouridine2457 synthase